jgi:hypothetical protein
MGNRQHPTINPYRIAISAIYERLRWDIRAEAKRSRDTLRSWKNRFQARSAVIMCNGPSLLRTDFDLLEGVFVFGLNKINLLFDKRSIRPDVIVAVNTLVLEQNATFFNETEIPLFLDTSGQPYVRKRDNVTFLKSTSIARFAEDVSMSVYQGFTVTYVAMQLAFHMGFERVALIGCDHNFDTQGPANATVRAGEHDHSHFDSRYFSGVNWQLPDLIQSEISYLMALDTFQMHGRMLCNCTDGGKLELLPRMDLTEFVNRKSR